MRLTAGLIERARYEGKSYRGKGGRRSWSRCVLWDDALPGFGVRISHTQRKTFVVKFRDGGRTRSRTLGEVGPMTLHEARKEARTLLSAIEGGGRAGDGKTEAAPARPETAAEPPATITDLGAAFLARQPQPRVGIILIQRRMIRHQINPLLGRLPLDNIRMEDLTGLRSRLALRFPAQGKDLAALLTEIFDWAQAEGLWPLRTGPGAIVGAAREAPDAPSRAERPRADPPSEVAEPSPAGPEDRSLPSVEDEAESPPEPPSASSRAARRRTEARSPLPFRLTPSGQGYFSGRFELMTLSPKKLRIETSRSLEIWSAQRFRIQDGERWAEVETTVLRCRLARTERTRRGEVRPVFQATLNCDGVTAEDPDGAWEGILSRAR